MIFDGQLFFQADVEGDIGSEHQCVLFVVDLDWDNDIAGLNSVRLQLGDSSNGARSLGQVRHGHTTGNPAHVTRYQAIQRHTASHFCQRTQGAGVDRAKVITHAASVAHPDFTIPLAQINHVWVNLGKKRCREADGFAEQIIAGRKLAKLLVSFEDG